MFCAIWTKLREGLVAQRIERVLDKDRILELYLNQIYLGNRAYGVAAASLNYFDKPLADLTVVGSRVSLDPAEGSGELSAAAPSRARGRAPQLRDRPHAGARLHHRRASRPKRARPIW